MKSVVVNRSVVIGDHKTTVSLEDAFWDGLKEIAKSRIVTISQLISSIKARRRHGNLSSTVRLCVLDYYKGAAAGIAHVVPTLKGKFPQKRHRAKAFRPQGDRRWLGD